MFVGLALLAFCPIALAQSIPQPTGTCPTFTDGFVTMTVDSVERSFMVWMDSAERMTPGPLLLYWHGTNGQPAEGEYYLGAAQLSDLLGRGGMMIAPVATETDTNTNPQWRCQTFCEATNLDQEDIRLTDELVACLSQDQSLQFDDQHIHSFGFSAGALQTSTLSFLRADYIASVVSFSGGFVNEGSWARDSPTSTNAANKFASLMYHGGSGDIVVISFEKSSNHYRDLVVGNGQYSIVCDHGGNHRVPVEQQAVTYQFFLDHPFGSAQQPYGCGLPAGMPAFCTAYGASCVTKAPTALGTTKAPTATGSTRAPTSGSTKAPTSGSTKAPSTGGSTKAPTTSGSTKAPTTSGSTKAPTKGPTTSGSTKAPTTPGSTKAPSTAGSTKAPTTSGSTGSTKAPSTSGSTGSTKAPTTSGSTKAPTTAGNTKAPTTAGNTKAPSTASTAPSAGPPAGPAQVFTGDASGLASGCVAWAAAVVVVLLA